MKKWLVCAAYLLCLGFVSSTAYAMHSPISFTEERAARQSTAPIEEKAVTVSESKAPLSQSRHEIFMGGRGTGDLFLEVVEEEFAAADTEPEPFHPEQWTQEQATRLVDRSSISENIYERLADSRSFYGDPVLNEDESTYNSFQNKNTEEDASTMKDLLQTGLNTPEECLIGTLNCQERFVQLVEHMDHVILKEYEEIESIDWPFHAAGMAFSTRKSEDAPHESTIVFYYDQIQEEAMESDETEKLPQEEIARRALPLLIHEMAHSYDIKNNASGFLTEPGGWRRSAKMEEYAYQEQAAWMRALGWDSSPTNREQWLANRISEQDYDSTATWLATGEWFSKFNPDPDNPEVSYGEIYQEVMAPYQAAEGYITNSLSIQANELEYILPSDIETATQSKAGQVLTGYNLQFRQTLSLNEIHSYDLFVDSTASWIYDSDGWHSVGEN